jgi:hypothetical protein
MGWTWFKAQYDMYEIHYKGVSVHPFYLYARCTTLESALTISLS